jgi:magnesium-transporting ATPase (P-type)
MIPQMKPAKAKTSPNLSQSPGKLAGGKDAKVSADLLEKSREDIDTVLKELDIRLDGLSQLEADSRLKKYGPNEIAREKRQSGLMHLLGNVKLGLVLRFYQEMRADNAAEKLKAKVSNTATIVLDGKESEVLLKMLVPGDIIQLAAGDLVPADVRVLLAKDLFLNQFDLRLLDILYYALHLQCLDRSGTISHRVVCRVAGVLCDSDPGSENLVYMQVWQLIGSN